MYKNIIINKNINYDHLLRVALTNKILSISIRKRLKPKKNFELKLINYRRIDPETKNLYYKKILKELSKSEDVITASIDPNLPKKLRSIIPSLNSD